MSSGDLGEVTPRSNVAQTQDGLVRRNRIHLRPGDCEPQVPCGLQPLPEQPVIANGADVGISAETMVHYPNSESPNENSPLAVQTSRYGRPITPPKGKRAAHGKNSSRASIFATRASYISN